MGELLIVIMDAFHLKLDFQVNNSLMKIFWKLADIILLAAFLVSSLDLRFSFDFCTLFFLISLLLLLLSISSRQIFRPALPLALALALGCASLFRIPMESQRLLRRGLLSVLGGAG